MLATDFTLSREMAMKSFLIKASLELVNLLFNNFFFFWICRSLGLVQSVFCVYPANEKYVNYFSFKFRQARNKWIPYIIGFAQQERGITLMFAVSATEAEITNPACGDNLYYLNERFKEIAESVDARSIHYAGVLPSYLRQRGVKRDQIERRVTVDAVVKAIRAVEQKQEFKKIILLGARGYIGSGVIEKLQSRYDVLGVEKGEQYTPPDEKHLVVNISVPYAIKEHLGSFNQNTTIINEVYPAPHRMLLEEIKAKGTEVYHIAGIKATMFPSLPGDYQGAMPCCGGMEDSNNEIIVKKM